MNAKNRIGRAALLVVSLGLAVSAPMAATMAAEAQGGNDHSSKAILKNAAILKTTSDRAILKADRAIL